MSDDKKILEQAVAEVSKIVMEMSAVQLGPKQASMVESRLRSRISRLGMKGFDTYLAHLKAHRESESQALLSLLTTHHTYFFREFSHFEFLINKGLENLVAKARSRGDKKIRIWSAACSRGQEAYSLAMFFSFHLKEMAPDVSFEIWATDIDQESIEHGKNAVYRIEDLKQIPAMYARDNWARGTGEIKDFAKIRDHLRQNVSFEKVSLTSPQAALKDKNFDVVFCRNVFIYFDQAQIAASVKHILGHLDTDGLFFIGVSESLNGLSLPVHTLAPSVYCQPEAAQKKVKSKSPSSPAPSSYAVPEVAAGPTKPLRVLCVDDSPVILTLLKKVLTLEHGYEVVATAPNGEDAWNWLKKNKADLMTLDIHMPVMDGVSFLQTVPKDVRPPVLVISSVNRDDPALGQKVLSLGAIDYVEKPSLENMGQASNEIRAKLRLGLRKAAPASTSTPAPVKSAPAVKAMSAKPAATGSATAKPVVEKFSVKKQLSESQSGKKKVLIVDDSATIRHLLRQVLSQEGTLEVVAEAERPSQVEALIEQFQPDVITLDIHMPEMDGVTLLRKIYPKYQIPTVMISSISRAEGPQVLQALESGAVDYIQKPTLEELAILGPEIRERIRHAALSKKRGAQKAVKKVQSRTFAADALILIGASTGGTEALRHVFQSMPSQIPPILVVQHIPPVFSAAFASRLNQLCDFEVKEAEDGDEVLSNRILIAPGGKQMGIVKKADRLFVKVNDDPAMNRHRPSVDYLFQSAANLKLPHLVAGILTGMGNDGAKGMKTLRQMGARTVGQDEATCVVYGMPREAANLGAVEFVKPLEEVADQLLMLAMKIEKKKKTA